MTLCDPSYRDGVCQLLGAWYDLFVGVSGAAAVLTGLRLVSLSINVRQILIAVGASLLAGGGLYWLVPAVILLLSPGVIYAWVLLIELLR